MLNIGVEPLKTPGFDTLLFRSRMKQHQPNGARKLVTMNSRVATDYVKSFKIGGILKLESSRGNFVLCEVTHLNFYKDFEDMLKNEDFKKRRPVCQQF